MHTQTTTTQSKIHLSVVAPAHNEEENIDELIKQVDEALSPTGITFEFVIVNDGSTDDTKDKILAHQPLRPWVRCISMTNTPAGSGNGQSAAFHAGFRATKGRMIAVLDADLQNDPADIPKMLELMEQSDAHFIQGDRSAARSQGDAKIRQLGSWVGRKFRLWILGDTITDTGCSLRVMNREIALALPLEFKGMHRFIPATARHLGYTVIEMPVSHRHRHAGTPKYGMGITKRALPGLIDLFAVRYMRNRRKPITSIEDMSQSAPIEQPTLESVTAE
ncbi:MAG: glycosyltransferase family 2 protein [Phycisphaerales bacterium]|nr:glycosyltransferase family 2 protein [Phycisphaerales bacterium]